MFVKRDIDRTHEKYAEYIEKCEKLASIYSAQKERARNRYPKWQGRDHPASGEIREIELKFNRELKKLQEEYSFLFFEVEPDED